MRNSQKLLLFVLAVAAGASLFVGGAYYASTIAKPAAIAVKAEFEKNPIVNPLAVTIPRTSPGAVTPVTGADEEANNLPEPPPLEVLKKARVVHPLSTTGTGTVAIHGRLY